MQVGRGRCRWAGAGGQVQVSRCSRGARMSGWAGKQAGWWLFVTRWHVHVLLPLLPLPMPLLLPPIWDAESQ